MTGVIFLESTELSADESDGAVQISVVRTGDLSGEVTVEFGITPDGATPGVDFDAPALGTVT
ncbi:MAG: Calx-beta domain-containing protein, partial [Pseudomonadota bacterium]